MNAGVRVGEFLKKKLEEKKLKRSNLAKEVGLSSRTINDIYNKNQNNIYFKTVLKLADYFCCSLDEVLERHSFIPIEKKTYEFITPEDSMNRIRTFINLKLKETNSDIPNINRECGLSSNAIRGFLDDSEKHQALKCNTLLPLIDYFNISLDELIGRSNIQSKTTSKSNNVKTELTDRAHIHKKVSQTLPSKDAAILNEIKQEIKEFHNEIKQKINTLNRVKTKG
jgi:plasmid maintenance system antidote protein VapI